MSRLGFQKELLSAVWQLRYDVARQAAKAIKNNKLNGIPYAEELRAKHKVCTSLFFRVENNAFVPVDVMSQSYSDEEESEICMEEEYRINIYNIDGIITRNGGGCSLGSKDIRDELIAASKDSNVLGHIFILDSPGGAANSAYDFRQGIDAARSAGQTLIGLIDGECASACLRLAVMLDALYFTEPHNQIGSVGTMAMFWGNKDGDVNSVTQEKYVEVYADASINKNGFYRKAVDGDYSELKELLNKENNLFIEEVKAAKPDVSEEMLSGAMFDCSNVVGILVDGQATIKDCCDMITNKAVVPQCNQPQHNTDDNEGGEGNSPCTSSNSNNSNLNSNKQMGNYPCIVSVLGVEPEMSEEGFFLNSALAQTIEEKLSAMNNVADELAQAKKSLDDKEAVITELQSQIETIKSLTSELDDLKAKFNNAETECAGMKEKLDSTTAQLDAFLEVADSPETVKNNIDTINELRNQIDGLNQSVEQKDKEIEELSKTATNSQKPDAAGGNDAGTINPNICEASESREDMLAKFKKRSEKLKNA